MVYLQNQRCFLYLRRFERIQVGIGMCIIVINNLPKCKILQDLQLTLYYVCITMYVYTEITVLYFNNINLPYSSSIGIIFLNKMLQHLNFQHREFHQLSNDIISTGNEAWSQGPRFLVTDPMVIRKKIVAFQLSGFPISIIQGCRWWVGNPG